MLALTKDQELTLFNWASTHGQRPGEETKQFLLAEKGIMSDQIDAFWNRMAQTFRSPSNAQSGPPVILQPGWIPQLDPLVGMELMAAGSQNPDDELFQQENDTLDDLPSFQIPASHMSYSSSYSAATHSDRSSTATSSSVFSQPFETWDYFMNTSTNLSVPKPRSTKAISAHSRDTSVSSVSHHEDNMAFPDLDFTSDAQGYGNPFDMNLTIKPGLQNWIQSKPEAPLPLFTNMSTFPNDSAPLSSVSSADTSDLPPPPPPKPSKLSKLSKPSSSKQAKTQINYACTECGTTFTAKKHDWRRHESSQCDPQTRWICMITSPYILFHPKFQSPPLPNDTDFLTKPLYTCVFCDISPLPSQEMATHLATTHSFSTCFRRSPSHPDRIFPRKDKLKDHLVKKHGMSKTHTGSGIGGWESWCRPAEPRKRAWGCGFCGMALADWEERCEHVAGHFERDGRSVSEWNMDLVVLGLLRQNQKDFDVNQGWITALARRGYRDEPPEKNRNVTIRSGWHWEESVASKLKAKLEYGRGKATEVAEEAAATALTIRIGDESCRLPASSAANMAVGMLSDQSNRLTVWPEAMVRRKTGNVNSWEGAGKGYHTRLQEANPSRHHSRSSSQGKVQKKSGFTEDRDVIMGGYF